MNNYVILILVGYVLSYDCPVWAKTNINNKFEYV